jgi:hypothetical protein
VLAITGILPAVWFSVIVTISCRSAGVGRVNSPVEAQLAIDDVSEVVSYLSGCVASALGKVSVAGTYGESKVAFRGSDSLPGPRATTDSILPKFRCQRLNIVRPHGRGWRRTRRRLSRPGIRTILLVCRLTSEPTSATATREAPAVPRRTSAWPRATRGRTSRENYRIGDRPV